MLPLLKVHDPVVHVGSRLLDSMSCISANIPVAPPCRSKVFDQWAKAWFQDCHDTMVSQTAITSDGSYKVKGQGVSAFVVQSNNVTTFSQSQLIAAHSSYDAEMQAAHMAILHVKEHIGGKVVVFIDNQSTLKSLFNIKPHSLIELS